MPWVIIGLFTILLGGASGTALHEHKQLQKIHSQADALQADNAKLKDSNDQAKQNLDAANTARHAAEAANAQLDANQGKAVVAASVSLKKTPPDVPGAQLFVQSALDAKPPTPETVAAGTAMAAANAAAQQLLVDELRRENELLRGERDSNAKVAAEKTDALGKALQTNTGLITKEGLEATQITDLSADKKSIALEFGLLSAKYGRLIFWAVIAGAIIFALSHLGVFIHMRERAAHAVTKTKLAAALAVAPSPAPAAPTPASAPGATPAPVAPPTPAKPAVT